MKEQQKIVVYYGILLLPLMFWWSWQSYSWLAWLSALACVGLTGWTYRINLRREYEETVLRHFEKNSLFNKVCSLFASKKWATILFLLGYLVPNFFVFWMNLGKTDFLVWIFIFMFPLIYVYVKEHSGIKESDMVIIFSAKTTAFLPAIALALIMAIWTTFFGDKSFQGTHLVGADSVLDFLSLSFNTVSNLFNNLLNSLLKFLPENFAKILMFLISFIQNFLNYWGVLFVISLMFSQFPILKDEKTNFLQIFKDKVILSSFLVVLVIGVGLICIKEVKTKYLGDELIKQEVRMHETLSGGKVIDVQKYEKQEKKLNEIKSTIPKESCNWFQKIFDFSGACQGLDNLRELNKSQ